MAKINDGMKLSGGFDLSDLERAIIQLKETQLKLSGHYVPPEERADVITKQDAEEQLQQTLSGGYVRRDMTRDDSDEVADLEGLRIKMNEKPSRARAERLLRETQRILARLQNRRR